ncbi:MAG: hypothetical protein GY822_31000 [Deltaproteobacteria bacterium]|nr:hypothetical protein [Deltaproteobacteria bacterium]
MADLSYQMLLIPPTLLLAIGATLFAGAEAIPRRLGLFLCTTTWSASAGLSVVFLLRILDAGGWANLQVSGFAGAQLFATAFHDVLWLSLRPKGALLLVLLHIASGLLLWVGPSSSGGGARRNPMPMRLSQCGLALMGLGGLVVTLMAGTLPFLLAGTFAASCAALGILFFDAPERDEANAASSVWNLHLVADGILLCGAGLAFAVTGATHPLNILQQLGQQNAMVLVPLGPLAGFPSAWVTTGISVLFAVGVFFRAAPLFLSGYWLRAKGASFPALSLAHHVLWMGGTLLLVDALAPLISLTPVVRDVLCVFLLASALWHTLAASVQRNVDALILHAPFSLALVAVITALWGLPGMMLLVGGMFWLGSAVLASCLSLVVEAEHHSLDFLQMGGLWQKIRRSETAFTLVVTSWTVLPFTGALLVLSALLSWLSSGNTLHWVGVSLLLGWGGVFPFALFRMSFCIFSGDESRRESPKDEIDAKAPEQGIFRVLPPLFVSLGMLIAPILFALPEKWMQFVLPAFRTPLRAFIAPESQAMNAVHRLQQVPLKDPAPIFYLGFNIALILAAFFAIGVAASFYRKNLSPRAKAFEESRWVQKANGLLTNYDLSERLIDRLITAPLDRISKGLWSIAYPVVVEGSTHRVVTVPLSVAGFLLRIANNGDVQRGLMVMLLTGAALLSWWSVR